MVGSWDSGPPSSAVIGKGDRFLQNIHHLDGKLVGWNTEMNEARDRVKDDKQERFQVGVSLLYVVSLSDHACVSGTTVRDKGGKVRNKFCRI